MTLLRVSVMRVCYVWLLKPIKQESFWFVKWDCICKLCLAHVFVRIRFFKLIIISSCTTLILDACPRYHSLLPITILDIYSVVNKWRSFKLRCIKTETSLVKDLPNSIRNKISSQSETKFIMDGLTFSNSSIMQSSLTMAILATIAVALRFVSKNETKAGLTGDDYWVVISLATFWAYVGVTLWGIFAGGGGLDMHNFLQGNLSGIQLYIKVSISLLLIIHLCIINKEKRSDWRIFSVIDYSNMFVHHINDRRQNQYSHIVSPTLLRT